MNENSNNWKNLYDINGPLPDDCYRERTHLRILGIDFLVESCVYVTDFLKKSLEDSARRHISTPVIVSAHGGRLSYSLAASGDIENVPPEHRLKVVVNGVETELLAVSEDDTPIPVLTQEHIEHAKNTYWLRDAYVTWAEREYPKMAGSHQLLIRFG